VPDEPLPPEDTLGFRVQRYGLTQWGDLFNARQKLALLTFAAKVREAHQTMLAEGLAPEFAQAVTTYLAMYLNRLSDKCSSLARWHVTGEIVSGTFSRQALPMVWDYFDLSPLSESTGDWSSALQWISGVLMHPTRTLNGEQWPERA